ncbi:hypothetical protein EJK51_1009 [Moraxella catarrhalis]|nr:hypothetical protein EJK52_1011 [Moraxella catarrhalis]AZQ91534.1 hypothetical protein EJK51_1009 [Moraxella catarrhalis]
MLLKKPLIYKGCGYVADINVGELKNRSSDDGRFGLKNLL